LTGLSEPTTPPKHNPAERVSTSDDDGEGIIATPEEVLQLARRLGRAVGLQVLTFAFTGPRYEELAGLQRPNVLRTRRQKHDGGMFECSVIRIDKDTGVLAEYYV